MHLTPNDIRMINTYTDRNNNAARYYSKEEKVFTSAAAAGLLLMWHSGLPKEIGSLVGSYLTRQDGTNMARVCKSANNAAMLVRASFLAQNNSSYTREPYTRPSFTLII